MSGPQPPIKWSVDDVIAFLTNIGLGHLGDSFRSNAVNGSDLIGLTDEDFTSSLGCTNLQVKKIRKEMEAFGVHAPADAPPADATAPIAAPTPAPIAAAAPPPSNDNASDIAQMQARLAAVQDGSQRYAQAQQFLRRAEADLKSAAGALTITQVSGATETLQDMRIGMRGGGLFGPRRGVGRMADRRNDMGHNVVEIATIQKAKKQVQDAAQQIQQAQAAIPNMPFIKPANVQQAMGGVFFNALLAPGLIGDMMQNAKVRQAKAQVNEMHVEVMQALDWCVNNMNASNAEAAQLQGALQAKA